MSFCLIALQVNKMLDSVPVGTVKLTAEQIKVGRACISEFDSAWFRASIEVVDGDSVTIRYVDYG